MDDATTSLVVLAVTVALFVWNRLPVEVVAIGCALALYVTGVLDAGAAVAGFGDPVVVFIACLFVIAGGLEASGVTAWAGRELVRRAGTDRARIVFAVMMLSAVLAALVTPNGSAAALLPVVVLAARRAGLAPSRLLLPLAFAASTGALLLLSGSPVNVIVSDALRHETGAPFGFFEFALMGLPLLLVTVAIAVLFGERLLPHRAPQGSVLDVSDHLETVLEHYRLDVGFTRLRVAPGSGLQGVPVPELVLPEGLTLVGVQHADGDPGDVGDAVLAHDVLVVTGTPAQVAGFADACALEIVTTPLTRRTREALLGREAGVAEVVVPPRSALVGQRVFPGQVRSGLTVLAVHRLGRDRGPRPTRVAEGDMLLLHGPWPAVADLAQDDTVLVVADPQLVRQQNIPLGPPAWRALAALALVVVLLATGVTTPAIAGLVGATAMVLLGVLTPLQVYRAVSWQTVVLIGGLIPLSVAISTSGAADLVAGHLVALVDGGGPRLLLAALFVLTVALGQVVSNTATVLVVTPIAIAAAHDSGVAVAPVLMLVAVAGAASFLTPIATPANMIVMGPAGYRFGDYWKLGLVTTAAWFVVAVGLIPLLWAP
ncbi:SLC13 family permease [Cellulomonas composti]|uniref:SLC13 family permease n=1 Tax=Cellulomonas composti TaxID=266130 RepID=A0A511J7A3_9CELL|nr:SLC13 family permease [Cellulomonas composti]GEL93579.1 SLC13 family permease [Cellulomonas composti]